MEGFKDKVAFITGGASGVGLGQAKVLSGLGVKVVLADIRQDHLDQALAWFRKRSRPAHGIRLDITDRAAFASIPTSRRRHSPVRQLSATPGISSTMKS